MTGSRSRAVTGSGSVVSGRLAPLAVILSVCVSRLVVPSTVIGLAVPAVEFAARLGVPVAPSQRGQADRLAELAATLVVAALRVRQPAVFARRSDSSLGREPGAATRLVGNRRKQLECVDPARLAGFAVVRV